MPSQTGRIAVITGANSGVGLETSIALAAAGGRVIMACRNPAKASAALAEVRRQAPGGDVSLMTLDLASLASVRKFASEFTEQFAKLDLLINNAGILGGPLTRTVDGFESQMGTNHFGHFALTGLLMGKLTAASGARIVTVGSLGHWRSRGLNFGDLNYMRAPYTPFGGYCNSKLANLLFAFELSRRLAARDSRVVAVAAHPGAAKTNISASPRSRFADAVQHMIAPFARRYLINTAAMAALPTLYAATMPDVQGNDYLGPDGFMGLRGHPSKAKRHRRALDVWTAKRLWEASEAATGVSYLN